MSNGPRIKNEITPEGRLAAVAVTLMRQSWDENQRLPDYADIRDGIRSYVRKELLLAELGITRLRGKPLEDRTREILNELADLKL